MQNKIVIYITLLFFFTANTYSSTYVLRPISQVIDRTEIIFIGELLETYQKRENGKDGSKGYIYTTYIFSITEILKGQYLEDSISVRKLGGCDSEPGDCAEYSFAGYDYKVGEEGLMFINYHSFTNSYRSSRDGLTAYSIQGSLKLLTSTSKTINYVKLKQEDGTYKDNIFTLAILRDLVDKRSNKN